MTYKIFVNAAYLAHYVNAAKPLAELESSLNTSLKKMSDVGVDLMYEIGAMEHPGLNFKQRCGLESKIEADISDALVQIKPV